VLSSLSGKNILATKSPKHEKGNKKLKTYIKWVNPLKKFVFFKIIQGFQIQRTQARNGSAKCMFQIGGISSPSVD
jgi:hypothetical protein